MANKPKTNYKATPDQQNPKDLFMTPRYGTRILLPFIPESVTSIWEPAFGTGRMLGVLAEAGRWETFGSDLAACNFLFDDPITHFDCIITNPPFSLKEKFAMRCIQYGEPWALLIPYEMNGWIFDLMERGLQWVVPDKRINFITPNIFQRIHEGELFLMMKKVPIFKRYEKRSDVPIRVWKRWEAQYPDYHLYRDIEETPKNLLAKYSAAQMATAWACWGFDLPNQINLVRFPKDARLDI